MHNKEIITTLRELQEHIRVYLALAEALAEEKPDKNRWVISAQVRKILGISDSTLKRMREKEKLPFMKIGSKYYYPSTFFNPEDVERVLMQD